MALPSVEVLGPRGATAARLLALFQDAIVDDDESSPVYDQIELGKSLVDVLNELGEDDSITYSVRETTLKFFDDAMAKELSKLSKDWCVHVEGDLESYRNVSGRVRYVVVPHRVRGLGLDVRFDPTAAGALLLAGKQIDESRKSRRKLPKLCDAVPA